LVWYPPAEPPSLPYHLLIFSDLLSAFVLGLQIDLAVPGARAALISQTRVGPRVPVPQLFGEYFDAGEMDRRGRE